MTKRMIVATLSLAGIFVALYLLLYKLGIVGNLACSIGSCETVNLSKWATFLGAPVAAWGVGFYIVMFVLALASLQDRYAESVGMSKILALVSGSGFAFSAWLTYLELFVIQAVCQWCVVSAVIVTIIVIFALLDLRDRSSVAGLDSSTLQDL
ncbi:MAG TPA: vitamin K epoxide reductase family protein [Gemmatimonadaceae bacterium]|nr:vitamin K epoxide reductase family protein [Gemmatimonadaceae bacterium]